MSVYAWSEELLKSNGATDHWQKNRVRAYPAVGGALLPYEEYFRPIELLKCERLRLHQCKHDDLTTVVDSFQESRVEILVGFTGTNLSEGQASGRDT